MTKKHMPAIRGEIKPRLTASEHQTLVRLGISTPDLDQLRPLDRAENLRRAGDTIITETQGPPS